MDSHVEAMRRFLFGCLFLWLTAKAASAQVQVDVHLEKTRYLAGEPIVLVVDVLNIGNEAVEHFTTDRALRMTIAGVERRVPPNIFGCFRMMGGGGMSSWNHPPLLPPGERTSFRFLLKGYDLKPGEYALAAIGRSVVRWSSSPFLGVAGDPASPPPRRRETSEVPGASFDRTLPLTMIPATEDELRAVLMPLVAAASAPDVTIRLEARTALIESAPSFLVSLFAQFAAEDQFVSSVIDALGRMGTAASRAELKNLLQAGGGRRDSAIMLALAQIGHQDDVEFFAAVLRDESREERTRSYAAYGLGRAGGDPAVRELERAWRSVPAGLLDSIVTALGNTRARAAVSVIISTFTNNSARNSVCSALDTLTHQSWCDGTDTDPVVTRQRWQRRWDEERARTPIFGPDNCPNK